MRKLVYYIGATLDGYIAGPGGEVDFFPLSDEMAAWIKTSFPGPSRRMPVRTSDSKAPTTVSSTPS